MWTHAVGISNRALARNFTEPTSGLPATEWERPGSGVAGTWGSNHFILTAEHVLENAAISDLGFFAKATGSLRHASESEMGIQDAFWATALEPHTATIHRCQWEDLAIIALSKKPETLGPYIEFAALDTSWVDPQEKQMVLGLGYPTSTGVVREQQRGLAIQKYVLLNPVGFSGEVLANATGGYYKQFDSESHYLMPFEPTRTGKHPRGISGAAAWVQSGAQQIVWTPNLCFAGIYTCAYKDDGSIVQVVKASVVRKFLAEVFGKP